MKKTIFTVLILVVCSVLFAAKFNVDFGIGFGSHSGKIAACPCTYMGENPECRFKGFDVHAGFNAEFENRFVIYDNIGVLLAGDIERKSSGYDWKKIQDVTGQKGVENKFMLSEDAGVAYAIHTSAMRFLLGGGLHTDFLFYKYKSASGSSDKNVNMDIGVNILLQGEYSFNGHFGAFVALKPSANLYNGWKEKFENKEHSNSDSATGFNISAVAGVTYEF